jgi:fatty-acyl-CoA synthase
VVTGRHKDMIIINGRNIWPQDIEHIAERQPELRSMTHRRSSCSVDDEEVAVAHVQCNISDATECRPLTQRLHREIHEELGISWPMARAPAHAAAHVLRRRRGRGARGLPAAARAGNESRAHRQRQAWLWRAGEPPCGGSRSIARRIGRARLKAAARPFVRPRQIPVPQA